MAHGVFARGDAVNIFKPTANYGLPAPVTSQEFFYDNDNGNERHYEMLLYRKPDQRIRDI